MIEKIQLLMMAHHMNRTQLAKAIGVSTGNIGDWVNGRSQPSVEKLVKIADYFDVSLDYLVDRGDRFPTPSPDTYELVRIYENLDHEGKTVVLGVAYQQKQRLNEGSHE